jgi:SAM-dependent methyltransferase
MTKLHRGDLPRATQADFVGYLMGRLAGHGDILADVGCGPGHYRHVTKAWYIGVDRDPNAYKDFTREIDVIADACTLPFDDGVLDVVMSKSAFYMFADPAGALMEFRRVLKPGGRLLLVDYNRRGLRELERGLCALVRASGFNDCRLELPYSRPFSGATRLLRLVQQEVAGQWAIVSALR